MAPGGPGCLGWELRSEPGDIWRLCRAGATLSWVRALQPGLCAPWVRALAMRLVTWSPGSCPQKLSPPLGGQDTAGTLRARPAHCPAHLPIR